MRKYIVIIILLPALIFISCNNENRELDPVVVLSENVEIYESDFISDDYIFVVENASTKSFLVNKEGHILYEWNFESRSGNDLEILPNGNIIGLFKADDSPISFGGFGGIARLVDLNGNTIWEYKGKCMLNEDQPIQRCLDAWQEAWEKFEAKQVVF